MQEAYIAAVLSDVYLPQTVKQEVKAQLTADFVEATRNGESAEAFIESLGSAEKIANRYNDHYRGTLIQKTRGINLYILGLVVVMSLCCVFVFNQFFKYAQERAMWYQYKYYLSLTQQSGGPRSQQNDTESSPRSAQVETRPIEDPQFVTTIHKRGVISCGILFMLCCFGIYFLHRRKNAWRSYTIHIPPSRAS